MINQTSTLVDDCSGAVSLAVHSGDMRRPTPREFVLTARLLETAAFDDEERWMPVRPGRADEARPDPVSSVSARLSPTNADERGAAARVPSRTTVVQHDEHQRDPTSAYDGAAHRSRFARSAGETPTSANQLPRASAHS